MRCVLLVVAVSAGLFGANSALAANTGSITVWHTPMVLAGSASTTIRVVAASAVVAAVSWAIWRPLDSTLGRSFPAQIVSLGTALTAAIAVYLLCCRLLRVRELDALLSLRHRLRRA